MEEIVKANNFALQLLGKQEYDSTKEYRLFKYVKKINADNKNILINLMTGEIIALEKAEFQLLNSLALTKSNNLILAVEKWFFVPQENDDLKLCKQFENTIASVNNIYSNEEITSYTILTTTDCNARCFYCYQNGCNHKTMSPQTAKETADFIIKKSGSKPILLRWFGGEPLYNSEAINIITSILIENNINFHSTMTSNAYLFDDTLVKKAVGKWNLKSIQITLDGTESVYNRVKSYIYNNSESAFERVTDNIEKLLISGVNVKIRLNMDKHNTEDLFKLADFLLNRYKGYDNIRIYSHLLLDNSCKATINRSVDEKNKLTEICNKLNQKFVSLQRDALHDNFSFRFRKRCMSDDDSAIMILPDGKLGKCEHFLDSNYIGDIYNGITDFKVLNEHKRIKNVCEKCEDCEYRIFCSGIALCPARRSSCDNFDKEQVEHSVKNRVLSAYKKYKT